MYGFQNMSYTVTEKGTVTIPAEIRRKYKLKTGSKVRFVETEHGALLLPAPSMEELIGILSKELGYKIIREINHERMKEASRDES
ncbi:MAG TPA: AbrB/MazE/SpoVT family DNA-binding domain-containing protein [Nitrososphaerales archaeon]|nr:AbrB/MazE/SpoVT family DNA-binding domain-containing protein [Nitrososphaerales archaeon]